MPVKRQSLVATVSVPCPLCASATVTPDEIVFPARLPEQITSQLYSARRRPDCWHYQLVRCANDGLVRSTPVLAQSAIDQLYQASQVTYQPQVPLLVHTYIQALQSVLAQLPATAPILEIGCGSGFLLAALQQQGFSQVYGVETSTPAVKAAPAAVRSHIWNQPVRANVLAKKKWQLIMLFQTFDHISQPLELLEQCYQALEPGGQVVSFHHHVDAWPVRLLGERHPIFDLEHHFLYSPKTTASVFEAAGFVVERLEAPANTVTLAHLCWLSPLPTPWKTAMLKVFERWPVLNRRLTIKLGNTWVVARKPHT